MEELYELKYMGIVHTLQKAAGGQILFNKPLIKNSLAFACNAHKNQKRCSGEDYIIHPLEVAGILFCAHVYDEEVIVAALLHDVIEKTNVSLAQLENKFGKNVKNLVDGVTKLSKIDYPQNRHFRQTDSIRKLLLTMSKDPRVILIKLADRLHNMRTLAYMPDWKKKAIACETLEIYSPMANLLGFRDWAWELEDLSFKFLNPKEYEKISQTFGGVSRSLSSCANSLKRKLLKLTNGKIKFEIQPFKKHNYHIYRAQHRVGREFNSTRDTSAIRITTDTVADCYELLGFVHSVYPPQPGKIKDYIAVPKINGYQGLHTVIFGPSGKMFHVQIRAKNMNERMYGKKFIADVLSIYKRAKNPDDFIHRVKMDMLGSQMFVFSSKGRMINLPENSTCVDFAYAIHPNLGNSLKEAVVNGKVMQPCAKLKTGDIVKVITDRTQSGPHIEWLEVVQTTRAQHYISNWYKFANKKSVIEHGKEKLDKTLNVLLGTTLDKSKAGIGRLIRWKKTYTSLDELFETIGRGMEKPCEALTKIYSEKYLLKSEVQKTSRTRVFKKLQNKSVKLVITTADKMGLLNSLTHCISINNINIEESTIKTFKETKSAITEFIISVKTFRQLCRLVMELEQIPGVESIRKV